MGGSVADRPGALLLAQDMSAPLLVAFAGGRAALYSARAPDKAGTNQDGIGLFELGGQRGVLAVADGVGGHAAGASAARIALEALERALGAGDDEAQVRSAILDGVELANREILELKVGAATTLAAIAVEGDRLRCYHAGDSEVLVVGQRGRTKLHTISHSPTSYAIQAGVLAPHEALCHADRHLVSNVVGSPDLRIEVGSELELAARDTALLATDGLFDNLTPGEIVEIVRAGPLDRAASELAERCRGRMTEAEGSGPSKPDDLTFVIFRPH
jgi:serine/threonine protein phosphatase PrpC